MKRFEGTFAAVALLLAPGCSDRGFLPRQTPAFEGDTPALQPGDRDPSATFIGNGASEGGEAGTAPGGLVGRGAGGPGGAAGEGALSLSVEGIAFGPVVVGFAAPATVTLTNSGDGELTPPSVAVEGTGAEHFLVTQNDCTTPLAPSATCGIGLAFQPTATGQLEALMVVGGETESPLSLPLSGEGLEAGELILEAAEDASTDFGDVPLGESREQTFRLVNPGDVPTGALGFSINSPAFQLLPPEGDDCVPEATSLVEGQGCDLRVRFAPSERGRAEATLTAISEDADGVSLNLGGNGQAPPLLELSAESLDFGDIVLEAGATLELRVRNAGDLPLPALAAAIERGSVDEFSLAQNGCTEPLGAGLECPLTVAFSPLQPGARSAALELEAGDAGQASVALSGTGLEPGDLLLSAASGSSSAFGDVLLGESREQSFVVSNPGDTPTGVLLVSSNNPEFSLLSPGAGDCVSGTTSLEGGVSCSLRVRFTPAGRQQRSATLTVSGASAGSNGLNLSGTGLSRAELVAQSPIDFGRIPRDDGTSRDVEIENAGDQPLGAVAAEIVGPNRTDFRIEENACNPGLGRAERCSVSVSFTPRGTSSRLATLRVSSDPGGSRDVRLEGIGLEPGALELAPASGSSTSFGNFETGSGQGQTQTFVLTNVGEVDSGTINVGSLTGGFQVLSASGGDCRSNQTNLAGGDSCTVRVRFSPSARGAAQATLSVSSLRAGTDSLTLNGTGLAPAQLDVLQTQLTFANPVTIGQSATLNVTVRNLGDVGMGAPSISFFGNHPGDFATAGDTCGGSVAPGSSCSLAIRFTPAGRQGRNAEARVSSNPGGTDSFGVSGTGEQAGQIQIQPSPDSPNFGAVTIGNQVDRTFTVRNAGDQSVGRLLSINAGNGFGAFTRLTGGAGDCTTNTTLGGGDSCNVRIRFAPQSAGPDAVTLSVSSQQGGTASLQLSGSGRSPAALQGAGQLGFALTTTVGSQGNASVRWTVTNTGGESTGFLSLTSNPQNRSEFPATNGCTGQLSAGSSCSVEIRFSPEAPGNRSIQYTLSDGQGATAQVRVSGSAACGPGLENDGGVCRLSNGQECFNRTDCASDACTPMYPDEDGDGFGDENAPLERRCGPLPPRYSPNNDDCCDLDVLVNPEQTDFFEEANRCQDHNYDCENGEESVLQAGLEAVGIIGRCLDVPASSCEAAGQFTTWFEVLPACGERGGAAVCRFNGTQCTSITGFSVINTCR